MTRTSIYLYFIMFICGGIIDARAQATATYSITDLGTLGGTYSAGYAINATGQVVGSSNTATDNIQHATLFNVSGSNVTRTDLGTFDGLSAYASGINNSGQISGYTHSLFPPAGSALLFRVNGSAVTCTDLGTLGGSQGGAFGINNSGQIVGFSNLSSNPGHATLFSVNGSTVSRTDLGTLGGSTSIAYAVNENGQIVGSSSTASSNNANHATLFSVNGSTVSRTDLGTLGGSESTVYGVNDNGQIVGVSNLSGNNTQHATLFSVNESSVTRTDLGTLGGSSSVALAINSNGQIVGNSDTAGNARSHGFLYTANGGMKDLNNLVGDNPVATDISISFLGRVGGNPINDHGQIAAIGTVNGQTHALLLTPLVVGLRADVNGDHQIEFSDTSLDKTTSAAPFRFWLNDDHDTGDFNDGDDLNDGIKDCNNASISSVRDLEDFAMINLQLPSNIVSQLHYGAKIMFTVTGTGSLHLVPVTRSGFDHLYDQVYARSLAPLVGTGVSKYTVSAGTSATISLNHLFDAPQSGDRALGFLFEGVAVGDLVLSGTIVDADGTTVAQSEKFFLHLDQITQYYDHFTVGDSTQEWYQVTAPKIETDIGIFSTLTNPLTLHSNIANNNGSNQPYILFVHGWRMETWKRRRFAETALKRLYWAGYRGSFGMFSWPSEYVDSNLISSVSDIDNYDRSEYQAWQSAAGLRTVLNLLENGSVPRIRLLAHSMGNVVASEALRIGIGTNAKIIDSYIASQAATVAAAYDSSAPVVNSLGSKPDVYRNWTSTNSYFAGISSETNRGVLSFCNPFDYALTKWDLNQSNKPDYDWLGVHDLPAYRYDFNHFGTLEYDKETASGSWAAFNLFAELDRYEAFAFAIPSSSRALGAEWSIKNGISSVVRLDHAPLYYSYATTDHSAEFLSSIQYQHPYWERVLGSTGLGTMPYDPETTTPTSFSDWSQMWFAFSGSSTTP